MLQNHPPAVYHRNIKLSVSNKVNLILTMCFTVKALINQNPNINLASWRSHDSAQNNLTLQKCPYFKGLKLQSSQGWKTKHSYTHTHTHSQAKAAEWTQTSTEVVCTNRATKVEFQVSFTLRKQKVPA